MISYRYLIGILREPPLVTDPWGGGGRRENYDPPGNVVARVLHWSALLKKSSKTIRGVAKAEGPAADVAENDKWTMFLKQKR